MIPDYIIVLCLIIILIILLHVIFQHSKLRILSKKLTRDEALYHSIFNQAPLGIAVVKDKNFVPESEFGDANINPACERILGRSGRELAQINWPDITHPDDLQEDLEKFGQFKAGQISLYSMEKRFLKPDGMIVWTNMHITHLLNGSGENATHLCLLEDITDRKKAESALAESERSKSVLLSRLPGMAYRCSYDAHWTMLFVSEGCFALTGYKPESLINNKDLSFNDLITPEYRESIWNEWARILPEGLNFKYEYEIITASGERKWVLELGQGVYDENRNVEALEGLILDITNRKLAEEKLRFYYEHDSLTGLFRYQYLLNMLESDAKKTTGKRALVGINLSSVQSFNITYGFYYTKDLMKKIADSLRRFCTDNCILFRTYESQLAFYIKDYKDKDELMVLCSHIAETLGALLAIERIGGGIGVVEIEEHDAPGAEQLLMNLLIASQKALSIGDRNFGVCYYNKEAELKLIREEEIKQELTRIAGDETDGGLYLQYQPIYDLQKKQICGFEALARM
jgi:PAS domain S-box-containing protein